MRERVASQLNFFNGEILRHEEMINRITHNIRRMESQFRNLDLKKDLNYYENISRIKLDAIREILRSYQNNTCDGFVRLLCDRFFDAFSELSENESLVSVYVQFQRDKEVIEKKKLELQEHVKGREKYLRLREINEYLHSNVTDEIIDEFMKLCKR
jgi:hypothetical protein